MMGGEVQRHPATRDFMVSLTDPSHPVTRNIKGYTVKYWEKWPIYEFMVRDEQYLVDYDPRVHVLATTMFRGRLWPVAWVKPWGKGTVFYTILGHEPAAVRGPFFQLLFICRANWPVSRARWPTTARYDIV